MKYMLVEAISQHRMRYCVEVPDDVGEEMYFKDGTRTFPITYAQYAEDTVTCEEAKEFSQVYLGEVISSTREVTLEEAIAMYREDNAYLASWTDEQIIKSGITEVGHSVQEKIRNECLGALGLNDED